VRAWDHTSGSTGTKVDTTTNGGTTAFSTATATANIIITTVNDAPVLSGANGLTAITEDQAASSGDPVSTLIAGKISDVDSSPLQGIAITATSITGGGAWQFSIDAGTTWNPIGAVSGTGALLLRDTDKVRFVPDAQNGATASLTFRAWDQTG